MVQKSLTLAGKSMLGWFPNDYDPTKAYNFEVFLPGSGEMDTPGTSKLLVNGPGTALPTNDPGVEIVVIAVEPDEAYEPNFSEPGTYLTAIAAAYKVNKFFLSGLSFGCQNWLNWFFQSNQNLAMIGGLFMLSPDPATLPQYGGPAMDYTLFKKNGILFYSGCGTADGFYANAQAMVTAVKAAGGTGFFDSWQGAAHGNPVWSDFWSTTWVSPAMGVSHYKEVATWNAVAPPVVVAPPPPVVAAPPAGLVLPEASAAQLATLKPTAPVLYFNTDTKVTTYWNGTAWT